MRKRIILIVLQVLSTSAESTLFYRYYSNGYNCYEFLHYPVKREREFPSLYLFIQSPSLYSPSPQALPKQKREREREKSLPLTTVFLPVASLAGFALPVTEPCRFGGLAARVR